MATIRPFLPVVLLVLVLTGTLLAPGRARATGLPAQEVVAAVTAAYGAGGTVAVAVARQLIADPDLPVRAAEARAAQFTARSADNGHIAQRPFPSASMVKLFLAEDVLRRARTGAVVLGAQDRELLAHMIRSSDDPAASAVWVRFDGPSTVRAVALRYELTGTSPPARAGQWGETMTTARDLARFLALLPVLAHPDDAAQLLAWMAAATPIAADGFDQRFGLFGTVAGAPAVKQGWMCCVGGSRHLHSVGVVGTRVVVLLSEVPQAVSYAQARAWLDAAGRAVPARRGGG
jgi:Beta-lactamase enzyme family